MIKEKLQNDRYGNKVCIIGGTAFILITQRNGSEHWTFLDVEDYQRLERKVYVSTNGYSTISIGKNMKQTLHRLFSGVAYGEIHLDVHHKNGNKLDNRKNNLEIMAKGDHTRKHMLGHKYNLGNKSRRGKKLKGASSNFHGVYLHSGTGKWRARARYDRKEISLGLFFTEIEAAEAYDNYVIENNVKSPLNFPDRIN